MARDYSKTNMSRQHKNSKGHKPFKLVLLSFLVGYLTASLMSIESLGLWLNKQKTAYLQKQASTSKSQVVQQQAQLPKPKFEFYTLLTKERQSAAAKPSAPVTAATPSRVKPGSSPVAKVEEGRSVSSVKAKQKVNFIIQVASFRALRDAERLKAALTLKGFDISITDIAQGDSHWYRVMTGPYSSRIEAEKAQTVIARSERVMGIIHKRIA